MEITGIGRSVPTSVETSPPAAVAAENREMIRAVQAINATELFGNEHRLTFRHDPETHRLVVEVVNRQTDEVVLQIPNEYIMRITEELFKTDR